MMPDSGPEKTIGALTTMFTGINATLYANGEAVAMNRLNTSTYTGGTVYLGKDVMGSVRGISNEYGLLEDRYEYDAFGKPYKGDLNNGMNLGYTGKPYDTTTGLYNYGYRDYQPEVARFTTVDPIRDGANWFAYVNNDPVNWVDPWGLSASDRGVHRPARMSKLLPHPILA
jgi:RHS repeat-associated protein